MMLETTNDTCSIASLEVCSAASEILSMTLGFEESNCADVKYFENHENKKLSCTRHGFGAPVGSVEWFSKCVDCPIIGLQFSEVNGKQRSFGQTTHDWSKGVFTLNGSIVGMKLEHNASGGLTALQFWLSFAGWYEKLEEFQESVIVETPTTQDLIETVHLSTGEETKVVEDELCLLVNGKDVFNNCEDSENVIVVDQNDELEAAQQQVKDAQKELEEVKEKARLDKEKAKAAEEKLKQNSVDISDAE